MLVFKVNATILVISFGQKNLKPEIINLLNLIILNVNSIKYNK
jgi:hypothetical protein